MTSVHFLCMISFSTRKYSLIESCRLFDKPNILLIICTYIDCFFFEDVVVEHFRHSSEKQISQNRFLKSGEINGVLFFIILS